MRRIAAGKILKWKDSLRRKPLIIRGARQVGKTWLVENVLGKEFENVVTIDLEARRDLHYCFGDDLNPDGILKKLEVASERILPGRTLLFLDEIQACPRAIMSLRYFYEKMPELHVVAAGSLLEFAFSEISVPVGRLQYLYLYPMTFYEYLLAIGKEVMAENVLHFDFALDTDSQEAILNELKNYFFTGGMPEVVKVYCETSSLLESFNVQSEIIDSYRDDFMKYTPKVDVTCLDEVLVNVAKSAGEQLKYSRLSSTFSSKTIHKAFELLQKSKIIHKIPSVNPVGIPLGACLNSKKFKASFLDIGLMQRLCQIPVAEEMLHSDLLNIYRGKLAEQFVAQELAVWNNSEVYYWARDARNSSAEVDFLTIKDKTIYPVEVKSGPSGKLKSLHLFLESYNPPEGFVLYGGCSNRLENQKISFLPLYATSYISGRNDNE